ncbi:Oidioi.mRNA.OKI2018_I69.chr2.g6465.t1.cds [Oikopleura dioica]|uniref:Oidioi.mRNA.OKI2018_I69.chr2.g6465.t1.cds n=1 Tax=Oikopleura dioica TaxID=34765 RepID=A0ABN7TCF5_OIKDI|nr:Oidioi.mRNA.OKI2018_I69.chr2.g6465.t1.cds [Oikopleura dioica]
MKGATTDEDIDSEGMVSDVEKTINKQKIVLKGEMASIIDKKLDQKIIEHQKEIKQLQAVIHNLRTQNRDFSKKADKKLKLLNMSVDQMNQLTEDIQTLKKKTDKLEDECQEIRDKFENASTKISSNLTNLSDLVHTKTAEHEAVFSDVQGVREDMEARNNAVDANLKKNQEIVDRQLLLLKEKMLISIDDAKAEAIEVRKEKGGCVIM